VDPSGKKRQLWKDGLGNILEVDEPTGGSSAAAGSGSVTVNGTEGSTQALVTPATSGTGSVQLSGAVQWKAVASASTGGTTNITVSGAEQQQPNGVNPGTGSVSISTPTNGDQVIPAVSATATVTISGSLQSAQVLSQAATKSSATIQVSGYLQSLAGVICTWDGLECVAPDGDLYDAGSVSLTVNGCSGSATWSSGGASSTASALVNSINHSSCPVTASAPDANGNFTITSTGAGASVNYGLSAASADSGPFSYSSTPSGITDTYDFGCCSYTISAPSSMSGGHDAVNTTVYDSGTTSVTVNGKQYSPSWSGSGTTAAGIASGLASAINNDSAATVSAGASGGTLILTAKTPGASGNVSLACSSSYDSSHFSSTSFPVSCPSVLSGGKNEIDDTGTVTVTINNHPDSATWGKSDTVNTIAQNLAASINKDTSISGVTASASGATVTLTSVVKGTIGNYPLSVSPPKYDSGHFSQSSFTVSGSGPALTGGWPNPSAVDSGTMSVVVNSNTYTINWGQNDTPGTIAGKLLTALGADPTVSPSSPSGTTTIYLDPKQPGTSYSFSTAYTHDSGDFPQPSFTTGNSISDYGTVTVTVNGHGESIPWAGHDSPGSIASALFNRVAGDSASSVNASASSNSLALSSKAAGANTNYTLASGTSFDSGHFSSGSFSSSNSGATLTGGTDAVYKTVYDSGTVTVSINGIQISAPYQQGSTAAGLAATLANSFNNFPSSPISISVTGSSLAITAVSPGANSNYSLSSSVTSNQTALFSTPSFALSASGSALTGGADASATSFTTPQVTLYSYDLLGNLLQVTQGQQTRTYSYDVLSRVTSTTTAEDGTTLSYYTAADGTLCSGNASLICRRKDARGITTTNTYDQLNRATSVAYDDKTTPSVTYFYDQTSYSGLTIVNGKGRLTGMSDGSGSSAWSYNLLGQISTEQRTISGVTQGKTIAYAYNLDGSLASLTYPSGRQLTYSYSNAQRALSATDTSTGVNYASAAKYAPQGNLASFVLGQTATFAGITQTYSYNNRMQLTSQQAASAGGPVLDVNFGFPGSGGNNGQLSSIVNRLDNGRTVAVTYDALHRIASAQTQATSGPNCWGQSFGYDRWANLLSISVTQCTTSSLSLTATNNQLSGFSYDLAGNMTGDSVNTYTYDAENRLTSAAGVNYVYDGRGLRVRKSNGTLYWRGFQGEAFAESDLSGNLTSEHIFFDGLRTARVDTGNAVFYYFTDQLGSTRAVTTSNGTVCYNADFTPYGGEVAITNTCAPKHKFTGYERDSETGLDYAIYRQYSSRLGRFLQPDALAGKLAVPQSLNRYAYALDDPLNMTDRLGLSPCPAGKHTPTADEARNIVAAARSFLEKKIKYTADRNGGKTTYDNNGNILTIDCSHFVNVVVNMVTGYKVPYTDQTRTGGIRNGKDPALAPDTAGPHVADVISFNGHVAIISDMSPLSMVQSSWSGLNEFRDLLKKGRDPRNWPQRMGEAKYFQICINDKGAPPAPAADPGPPQFQAPDSLHILDLLIPPPPPTPVPAPPPTDSNSGPNFGVTSTAYTLICGAPGVCTIDQPLPLPPDDGGADGGGDGGDDDCGSDCPALLSRARSLDDFLMRSS
jgi:RHS repeat-associated protein